MSEIPKLVLSADGEISVYSEHYAGTDSEGIAVGLSPNHTGKYLAMCAASPEGWEDEAKPCVIIEGQDFVELVEIIREFMEARG